MDFTKIKFDGQKTEIRYFEEHGGGTVHKETVFRCNNERHEDFVYQASRLIEPALEVLQLPQDYSENIEFRSVSLSNNEHQGMGAVITMMKTLPGMNAPFVMNTPHMHNAEDGDSQMPTEIYERLIKLQEEAEAFMKGKSAQGDMFAKAA